MLSAFLDNDEYLEYYIKNHLGNTRVRIADKNSDNNVFYDVNNPEKDEVMSSRHYYPFGMEWDLPQYDQSENSIASTRDKSKYTYDGKEHISDLGINLNDYGARYYDAAIARFTSIDRFAEKYSFQNGYAYAANDPIKHIDVNGDSIRINGVNYTPGMSTEVQDELVSMGITAMIFLYKNSETADTEIGQGKNKVTGNALTDFLEGGQLNNVMVDVNVGSTCKCSFLWGS